MTDTPKKLIVNVATGTHEYIDLTPGEIAERDQMAAQAAEEQAIAEAEAETLAELKASAKAKLIAGSPLTEEEAATIVI
jgi:regulator of protease activity HflC (stomatin/prohibitin superfamily)